MIPRPKTHKDVWLLTALAVVFSIVITGIVVPLMFDIEDPFITLVKCAGVATACSVPVGFVLANEMRKNENLNDTLLDLVNRDRLTDAATRDYFFGHMETAPESYGVSLMIDIDHFKSINDQYGHLVGDKVIRRVAKILRSIVRENDIVCRFGGEEFIVFLAEYQAEDGVAAAERIRKTIETDVINLPDVSVSVTVSIGGSLKDALTDINHAIKQADDALYLAKAGGRNQTKFAECDAA